MNNEQFQQFMELTKAVMKDKNEEEQNKSFYYLFVEQFAPKEHQHHWKIELHELYQKKAEKEDTYATKFKKLISRVNVNNGFSDSYVVRKFLNELKGNNATFVAQRVGNELSDIKKRIEGLTLNYAILSAKLKDTESNRPQENIYKRYNQNNYKGEKKRGIEYRKCGGVI
ncbi:38221_t:CDS:2 [Gigaspora margarita]|uniref:38221_t:CDS:1 n=1 Tax=Gigaspora margarita TaxID=4874 RepID=A0ABM8VZ16_GIGMA|nr:38221_t:CDS:2 [Gigaspora margarita]